MTDLKKAAEMAIDAMISDDVHKRAVAIVELRQALAQPEPTVEDNSQNWKGMDGAVAWHLIDRHADNWADVGKMMDKWLKANQAQPEQEAFHRLLRIMGTFDLATGHADSWNELLDSLESELRDVLGYLRTRREWVGVTYDEVYEFVCTTDSYINFAKAIEAKLKERNCG